MSEQVLVKSGGGATHVARITGSLASLSNHLSDILVVAGGGGGSAVQKQDGTIINIAKGGSGGGCVGGSPYYNDTEVPGKAGTQSSGFAFGQGKQKLPLCSGGGGGLYGGDGSSSGIIAAFLESISVSKGGSDSLSFTEEVTVTKVT